MSHLKKRLDTRNQTVVNEEMLRLFVAEARGDLAVFVLLWALRQTENGGPGKEMGILVPEANTLEEQIAWAGGTIRKNVVRYEKQFEKSARDSDGMFTDDFLKFFSNRYAPVEGATNDPTGLNRYHYRNLKFFYTSWVSKLVA